jgi:hypothetical protein
MEFFIVLVWVVLAVLVGQKAAERGRSGLGYGLLSLVFSPVLGIIFVLASSDLVEQARRDEQQRIENARHLATIKALVDRQK